MTVRFRCPNGHKLKFEEKDSGKQAKCPKCHISFLLPAPPPAVSETSIVAILGNQRSDRSVIAHPTTVVPTAATTKMCPKCKARIRVRYQICPHCRTYLPLGSR